MNKRNIRRRMVAQYGEVAPWPLRRIVLALLLLMIAIGGHLAGWW